MSRLVGECAIANREGSSFAMEHSQMLGRSRRVQGRFCRLCLTGFLWPLEFGVASEPKMGFAGAKFGAGPASFVRSTLKLFWRWESLSGHF